jgi:prepilin-type N-terminal cleavage/methylation domain-containing protein
MKHRAFTLVELLVVIAIIGLLSTVAVVAMSSARVNARNAQRKANLVQTAKALEVYYANNNAYPSTAGAWQGNCADYSGLPDTGAGGWIPGLAPVYMATLPHDPNSGKVNASSALAYCRTSGPGNCYIYRSDGIDYKLLAHCTPEGTLSASDPLADVPRWSYAYAIYTPAASAW